MAHTPGPWVAHEQQSEFGTLEGYYVVETGRVQIADLFGIVKGERDEEGNEVFISAAEAAANAKLIAASPDLLQVVESVVMWPDIRNHIMAKFPGIIRQANAALAKAGSNMALPIDTEGGAK